MGKKSLLAIGAVALAALLAVVAHAQLAPRRGHGMQHGRMFETLNLTDAQKKSISDIFAANRESTRPLMQQLRDQHRALNDASQKQPFDESTVRFQAQELSKIQSEMMVRRAAVMNQVSAVLTPDQRTKLQELKAQRQARFKEHFQQRRTRQTPQAG